MSTPRIIRATQRLLHQISRMAKMLTKRFIHWLLRGLLVLGKQPNWSKAGMVLPTTVLLLLVVTLTVGAIGFRTFTRTQQTIGERQQRVIYNAATPAIDRAKAKLEFLFDIDRDPRGGPLAKQEQLMSMMLNDGVNAPLHASNVDPYTFTDSNAARSETRVDINSDGKLDNAWRYKADTNGDGVNDATIAYSIVFTRPTGFANANDDPLKDTRDNVAGRGILDRAAKLQVRNAPLSNSTQTNRCSSTGSGGAVVNDPLRGAGWWQDTASTTIFRKNFQVDVYVLPDNPNGTVATLEFQQDRQANQGFKWAAWFRNDLEIFPGPQFNWNGAMHTEGNVIVGSSAFRGYMISSIASCLYTQDASEITTTQNNGNPSSGIPPFQGQFLAGTIKNNIYEGTPKFDLWNGTNTMPLTARPMATATDSVSEGNFKPADFALEPVKLHTDDISISRNPAIANPASRRDPNWENRELNQTKRMYNLSQPTPYLDDTFRADDRWGPKPRWGFQRDRIDGMGEQIVGNTQLTGNDPLPGQGNTSVGLDGYWERRARNEGLRLIVGQRLELGDPTGWGGTAETPLNSADVVDIRKEPLRPWLACVASNTGRCNEARQRKTLWDNLASVQATAVYHANYQTGSDRDFPIACLATTVHPGTAGTLDKSGTFENLAFGLSSNAIAGYTDSPTPLIISDFFRGRGTNGWEYNVPAVQNFRDANSPLRTALRNLAQFAGDPQGGTPSFQPPPADGFTHPYPLMSMWGDYSVLRRVISRMEDEGVSYDALSPADKTALHTAGCTLGMLAYNLDYLEKLPKIGPGGEPGSLNSLMTGNDFLDLAGLSGMPPASANFGRGLRGYIRKIDAAIDETDAIADNNPILADVPDSIKKLAKPDMDAMTDGAKFGDPETYVRLLERWRDLPTTTATQKAELTRIVYLAQLIVTREQVARDRTLGFYGAYGANGIRAGNNESVTDPTIVSSTAPLGECAAWRNTGDELARLCSVRPRYPILYSLFPAKFDTAATPASISAGYAQAGSPGGFQNHGDLADRNGQQQRSVRDYVDRNDSYIKDSANAGVLYKVVRPADVALMPRGIVNPGGAILMGNSTGWRLPTVLGTNGSTPNSNSLNLIKVCATAPCSLPQTAVGRAPAVSSLRFRIPFKDAGFYNGRELMSVRTLDLDLDLMRNNNTPAGDPWLPKSGIIYAFREDAVSEAHIARPKRGNWASCASDAALQAGSFQNDDNCRMRTLDGFTNNFDPPLSPLGITPKPVDYYADPDRRPYGFRLRNGASVSRTGDNGLGLSFITDNPAYVQGPFNLHRTFGQTSTARANGLEEFITPAQRLDTAGFTNFYTRNTIDDTNFSKESNDQWRPSEVLADAVSPLSSNFCDGSIEDSFTTTATNGTAPNAAFVQTRYGCTSDNNNSITSYQNQPRAQETVTNTNSIRWMRATVADSFWPAMLNTTGVTNPPIEGESPIFIHGSANPQTLRNSFYTGRYSAVSGGRTLIDAVNGTQMNMIMVSGIVASRAGQSYGGLHNFPRFLENWNGKELFMSGAFLQLNFSTYATAPFDQENWQITDPAVTTGTEWISYYSPPPRRWGYDVGLQYAPAGPVAQRFAFSQPTRSEFYSEPAANDPYIRNLCRSISANCP